MCNSSHVNTLYTRTRLRRWSILGKSHSGLVRVSAKDVDITVSRVRIPPFPPAPVRLDRYECSKLEVQVRVLSGVPAFVAQW